MLTTLLLPVIAPFRRPWLLCWLKKGGKLERHAAVVGRLDLSEPAAALEPLRVLLGLVSDPVDSAVPPASTISTAPYIKMFVHWFVPFFGSRVGISKRTVSPPPAEGTKQIDRLLTIPYLPHKEKHAEDFRYCMKVRLHRPYMKNNLMVTGNFILQKSKLKY
eukprot:GHVQ01002667.1.p1 GENE.GHVQ01002667.1~~GHVQ01002667.1.p1  ORF type:complete len:162 (-),score=15.99 GHVQ01002667.1:87-572(-)